MVSDIYKHRQSVIQAVFIIGALVLLGQAFNLQVLDTTNRQLAEASAMGKKTIYPSRGLIYDRNDSLLVFNKPIYDVIATYNQIDPNMDTVKFCELLRIDKQTFIKNIEKDWDSPRFSKSVPFVFLSKIPQDIFAVFHESLYQFPGFEVTIRSSRGYTNQIASNLFGYLREVNQAEIDSSKKDFKEDDESYLYRLGDYIGESGLEKQYETYLRGKKGLEVWLKDNLGRRVDEYNFGDLNESPEAGDDLILSIDHNLQEYAEQLMENKRGGLVALDPDTGEILAMVSSPGYDPNLLSISESRGKAFKRLVEDPNLPFHDRSIMAQYPPGSLFKTFVALVALQEGLLNPNRTIKCNGAYYFNGKRLTGCHAHPTCRNVSMALQNSCNAYFVTVFREIIDKEGYLNPEKGLGIFNGYMERFGFGQKLGVDIPREQSGYYPTSTFYDSTLYQGQRWRSLWIRSNGIGQGELLMTTLQMANLSAIIANRGYYINPHLLKLKKVNGVTKQRDKEYPKNYVGVDARHFEPVIDGMELAVSSGTAYNAYIDGISVCGKTGTAENNQNNKEDHSVFMGFAPKHNPQIAVAVFIENAGFGGTYATPIGGLVMEKKIQGDILSSRRKWLEKRMLETNLLDQKLADK